VKNPLRLVRIYGMASRVLLRLDAAKREHDEGRTDPARLSYASASWWRETREAVGTMVLALPIPEEMKHMILRNWKTTLSGVAALLAIASKVAMTGQFDWATDSAAVIAAIGLITAKDGNVSGTK